MKVGTVTLLQIGDVFSSRSDSMVYNAQYRYIDILLEKLNKEIKINPDTKIIVNTIYDTKLRNINGDWVFYWLTWMRSPIDSSSYKSTFKTHFFIPQIQNTIAVNQKTAPVGKEVYYVFLPWLSFNGVDTDINALKRLYVFGNKKRIEINGYYLEYYQIKRI